MSLLLGVYLHLILKSNINFPFLAWKTSQRLEIFWSQKIFFNLPTRPSAALTRCKNAWNIFPSVESSCYDISDGKWRNNKAINEYNEDQLTLHWERIYFDAELCTDVPQPQLFILSIDFWQLSRLDWKVGIEHLIINIYISKIWKTYWREWGVRTMGCVKLSSKIKRIFWSLLPLIKRQDTPHPLKYYDNPLHTLYYIC